jgi:hypothetical protein
MRRNPRRISRDHSRFQGLEGFRRGVIWSERDVVPVRCVPSIWEIPGSRLRRGPGFQVLVVRNLDSWFCFLWSPRMCMESWTVRGIVWLLGLIRMAVAIYAGVLLLIWRVRQFWFWRIGTLVAQTSKSHASSDLGNFFLDLAGPRIRLLVTPVSSYEGFFHFISFYLE